MSPSEALTTVSLLQEERGPEGRVVFMIQPNLDRVLIEQMTPAYTMVTVRAGSEKEAAAIGEELASGHGHELPYDRLPGDGIWSIIPQLTSTRRARMSHLQSSAFLMLKRDRMNLSKSR